MAKKTVDDAQPRHWQRQESRMVRPFRSMDGYLENVGLRLYPDAQFVVAPVLRPETVDRERLAPQVQVPPPPANLEESIGFPATELRLLVSVEDRLFKDSVISVDKPLAEHLGGIVDLDKDSLEHLTWASDTRIHVSVVLARERTGEFGTAQRAGSWVARKTFQLARQNDAATFDINAVDPEYFIDLGLPSTTTYYVDIVDDDLNQPCEGLPDLVKVNLLRDVHTALARDEQSLISEAIIKSIYVDVVTSILVTGFHALKGGDLVPNGILDTVTKRLSKATSVPEKRIREFASDASGARLRAVAQGQIELTRALVNAVRRKTA